MIDSPARVIAIDGPAASGKSTVGQQVAQALGYFYFDTGLLYRAVTWKALHEGVPLDDGEALARLVQTTRIEIGPSSVKDGRLADVRVDGQDVTWLVRSPEVDRHVSQVAAHPAVRQALLPLQRAIARHQPTVMAGRDIGTVVLPDADLKVFLTASLKERARRRLAETRPDAGPDELRREMAELARRDELDSTRAAAPLRQAPDAVVIDTDHLSAEQVVERVVSLARARGLVPHQGGPPSAGS